MFGLRDVGGRSDGLALSRIGVSMADGQSTLTRTPSAAASMRRLVDRPTTACFVVAYGTRSGAGRAPPSRPR